MQQILAFNVDLGAAGVLAQPFGVIQRGRPAGIVGEQVFELGLKCRIEPGFEIRLLELLERSHQDLGYVTAAVGSEVALWVWLRSAHDCSAAFTNSRTLS